MVTHASPWDFMSECTAIFPRGALWKATRSCRRARRPSAARAGAKEGRPACGWRVAALLLPGRPRAVCFAGALSSGGGRRNIFGGSFYYYEYKVLGQCAGRWPMNWPMNRPAVAPFSGRGCSLLNEKREFRRKAARRIGAHCEAVRLCLA
jgi:hypothetical protein